jgi:hypothetical protein
MIIDAIVEGIESAGADLLFGLIVLVSFGLVLLGLMFFLLAVRGMWRWLTRHTWGDVVASAGRKALK